jgi:predicted PurR-regulated permease PerM
MPSWAPKAIALFFAYGAATWVIFWLAGRLRTLLVLLLVSLFIAFAIEPAVNFLARRGWRRGVATAVVFLVLVVIVAIALVAIGSLVVSQVGALADALPGYTEQTIGFVNRRFGTHLASTDLADQLRSNPTVRNFASGLATTALGLSTTVLGVLFQGFAVGLFVFYLAADGPRLRRAVCSLLPPRRQRDVLRAWDLAVDKTGGYVASRGVMAALSALAHGILFVIIGVPYPLALALWVGMVSQFVPTVGTYLAAALPVLVALLNDPIDALWVIGFVIVYQQLENLLISPRITAQTMAIHPAVAFGSVIAGAAVLGGVGALLALPATASLQAFASNYMRRYEVVDSEKPAAEKPTAEAKRRTPPPDAAPATEPDQGKA